MNYNQESKILISFHSFSLPTPKQKAHYLSSIKMTFNQSQNQKKCKLKWTSGKIV